MIPRRRILQLFSATALAGCSSTPAKYYRIIPVDGPVLPTPAVSLRVRNIGIPGYLQQNGIAEPSARYQFDTSAEALWAEPLADMLQAVLVQDLTQLLPQATVSSSSGTVGTPADLVLEVNLQRFDPDDSGRVILIAQIALKNAADNQFLSTRTLRTEAAPAGTDMPSMMAAMSGLWAGLADAVAQEVARNAGVQGAAG